MPISKFVIPVVSWQVTPDFWASYKPRRLSYGRPEEVVYKIEGTDEQETRLRVRVLHASRFLGYVYIPPRYASVWRRLIYSALYWECLCQCWHDATAPILRKVKSARTPRDKATLNVCSNADVKLLQHLVSRRFVLQEVQELAAGSGGIPDNVHSLNEYAIRDARDWLHMSFQEAHRDGKQLLKLDPTDPKNDAQLRE